MTYLIWSLAFNCLLLFCLLAPNIVMFIHSSFFEWKVDPKIKDKALMFAVLRMFASEYCPEITFKELQDWFNSNVK